MEHSDFLLAIWKHMTWILYIFVFFSLLPKSWRKIQQSAKADECANAGKYHRCYAPDICCHTLGGAEQKKPKARKAVTRVYPKKSLDSEGAPSSTFIVKRTVPSAQIQQSLSNTNVNQIAKMFEAGGKTHLSRKVNRVTPILTEIQQQQCSHSSSDLPLSKVISKTYPENPLQYALKGSSESRSSPINQDNIENSVNLLNLSYSESEDNLHTVTKAPLPPNGISSSALLSSSVSNVSSSSTHLPCSMPASLKTSLEDIFVTLTRNGDDGAGNLKCNNNNPMLPVTSIDEILAQRRLSRPLSAYSISDLLCDSPIPDDACIEHFFKTLNKGV